MARITREEGRELLRRGVGKDADFRPQQWEAIDRLVNDKDRLLIVQRTGWGKSMVYFIATRLLRDQGAGPTLIISPLLALMHNQIEAAEHGLNLNAVTINSANEEAWEEAKQAVIDGSCDLLLVSPERLANEEFREAVLAQMVQGFGMLVVDEAHCISDWGHDFRPDYRRIQRILERLPENIPVAATTATANDRVVEDVIDQLPGLSALRGPLTRDSLRLQAIQLDEPQKRLAWVVENIPKMPGSGIIYCLTKREVERVAAWLQSHGIEALHYHGGLGDEERHDREQKLLQNEVKALVATNALGMGFDKPDLGFVVHFQRPPNLIRYYQEIGRAGRKLDEAYAVLLSGDEDDGIAEYFIENGFPEPDVVDKVLSTIEDSEQGIYQRYIQKAVDIKKPRLEQCLKLLRLEGAIAKDEGRYVRTPNPWSYDHKRVEGVTEQRWRELEQIQAFVETDQCLMRFIVNVLDDELEEDCGQCANCSDGFFDSEVDRDLIFEAIEHYRGQGWREIKPRAQLPHKHGTYEIIDLDERIEYGRALSVYGDPGWGWLVRKGKYEDGRFGDELVDAAVELIEEDWHPEPAPTWVTSVPSTSCKGLIADFAQRLADKLGIDYVQAVEKVRDTPPQKEMENSYHKCWNVQDAFEANGNVQDGPVLLVDDIFASRWTLTEVGRKLRQAGSGPVLPFALAERRGG